RVFEDLHPRGLRDLALPRADVSAGRAEGRARLSVPLLDVRPGERRRRALRTGRPAVAAAAAAHRLERRAAGGRQLLRRGRTLVVGRAESEPEGVIAKVVRYVDERTAASPYLKRSEERRVGKGGEGQGA